MLRKGEVRVNFCTCSWKRIAKFSDSILRRIIVMTSNLNTYFWNIRGEVWVLDNIKYKFFYLPAHRTAKDVDRGKVVRHCPQKWMRSNCSIIWPVLWQLLEGFQSKREVNWFYRRQDVHLPLIAFKSTISEEMDACVCQLALKLSWILMCLHQNASVLSEVRWKFLIFVAGA